MENKYITVLDFEIGRVFQYKLKEPHRNKDGVIDHEEFLTNYGHNMNNCEWMVHDDSKIWADHSVGQVIMKECH